MYKKLHKQEKKVYMCRPGCAQCKVNDHIYFAIYVTKIIPATMVWCKIVHNTVVPQLIDHHIYHAQKWGN